MKVQRRPSLINSNVHKHCTTLPAPPCPPCEPFLPPRFFRLSHLDRFNYDRSLKNRRNHRTEATVGTEGVLVGGPGYTSDLWPISTLFGDRANVKRGNSRHNESTKEAIPYK